MYFFFQQKQNYLLQKFDRVLTLSFLYIAKKV
jgi:hypothetical protein